MEISLNLPHETSHWVHCLPSQRVNLSVVFVVLRYSKVLPSLQARQFSAATGLSRLLIILGVIEPTIKGENVSEEVIQRQVRQMHAPRTQTRRDITMYCSKIKGSVVAHGMITVLRNIFVVIQGSKYKI